MVDPGALRFCWTVGFSDLLTKSIIGPSYLPNLPY